MGMFKMSLIACHTLADSNQFNFPLRIRTAVIPEFPFETLFDRLSECLYHLSRLRQVKVKPQIVTP